MGWKPSWMSLGSELVSVPPFLHLQNGDDNACAGVPHPSLSFSICKNKGLAPRGLPSPFSADVLRSCHQDSEGTWPPPQAPALSDLLTE